MQQIFVIDTNVLIDDPDILHSGDEETQLIIPIIVVQELDDLKTRKGIEGRNARETIRILDALRSKGDLISGVYNKNKALVYVHPIEYDNPSNDDKILASAAHCKDLLKYVVLLSNDCNVRIKAQCKGIKAEAHESKKISYHYTGLASANISYSDIHQGFINSSELNIELYPNQFISMIDEESTEYIGRYIENKKYIKIIPDNLKGYNNISPKNREQKMLMDVLLDDNISLVTTCGLSGSGKTLLTLAAGLLKVDSCKYDRMMISRSMKAVADEELGFLPGDVDAKMLPWMANFTDNLEKLDNDYQRLFEKDYERKEGPLIEILPLTYLRGRSIDHSFIFLDECQNISKDDLRTFLTRAGKNTKIVLAGDLKQIDSRFNDEFNNGLAQAIELFKPYDCHAHITLIDGTLRSDLAALAARIL